MSDQLPLVSRSLPIALLRARERVMGPIRKLLIDAGVTEQQWRVLRLLKEEGASEPTDISERACLLLPSLTRILQKLEDKGLIKRRCHPKDRRRQIVEITAKGEQIIQDNLTGIVQQADRMRAHLGPEKHETLLDILNELKNFEE
jgi:homoprotocatechuate degradation regulator HpaR